MERSVKVNRIVRLTKYLPQLNHELARRWISVNTSLSNAFSSLNSYVGKSGNTKHTGVYNKFFFLYIQVYGLKISTFLKLLCGMAHRLVGRHILYIDEMFVM